MTERVNYMSACIYADTYVLKFVFRGGDMFAAIYVVRKCVPG